MIFGNRLMFTPFWRLTAYGCMFSKGERLIDFGGDEFHNRSLYVIVPLVGMAVLFYERHQNTGPEHLYACVNGEIEGFYDENCAECINTMRWITEDDTA